MIKYLFLDFDGVLHPGLTGTFRYLSNFEKVLRTYPHLQVVFSTSWRLSESVEQLRENFSEDVQNRFIGCTPEGKNREVEILEFCKSAKIATSSIIAIDDEVELFPSKPTWLHWLNAKKALDAENTDLLLSRISLEMSR